MKFSHSLILNAVPSWIEYYIDYDHLKKIVYKIERIRVQTQNQDAHHQLESQSLINARRDAGLPSGVGRTSSSAALARKEGATTSTNAVFGEEDDDNIMFLKELDKQLDKITDFFLKKADEILQDASTLHEQFEEFGIPLSSSAGMVPESDTPGENDLRKLDSILSGRGGHDASLSHSPPQQQEQQQQRQTIDESPTPTPLQNVNQSQRQESIHDRPARRSRSISFLPRDDRRRASFTISAAAATAAPSTTPPTSPIRIRRRSETITGQIQQQFYGRAHPHHRHGQPDSPTNVAATDIAMFNQYYNFRARCAATFISLSELKSYVDINRTGFDKILKKWDKVTGSNLRKTYYEKMVTTSDPFLPEQNQELDKAIVLVRDMYAAVFTHGDIHAATGELKLHMRDHIQFERTTVWKDLVAKERLVQDAHAAEEPVGYNLPWGGGLFITRAAVLSAFSLCIAVVPFAVFISIDVFDDVPASKCLGLLLFAAIMWALEVLPIYATAYLIVLLIPTMDIVRQNGDLVDAKTASKLVFQSMFNGTIMVLLGGFAIAAALSKHGIARAFASVILARAGTKPSMVVIVNMYLAAFLSMWISNVATPVLCTSLVGPILRTLPPNSTVGPCLILGIALASCIGGLTSPISSPQNIITINIMQPSPGWGKWFAASLPIALITILTTWGCLLLYFRPHRITPRLNSIRSHELSRPSFTQIYISVVCLATIALWCSESSANDFWGDNGVIAAIPFVLFFGTGVLSKTDLNNFLWPVVILAQGGMALGFAVESSGLLDIIGHRIAAGVDHLDALAIVFIFGVIVLVFATFVSHTVAALIILPIVQEVGQKLDPPHPNLLVMVTGLVSSVAMGLPISGFPNMNAFMLEDLTGKSYLTVKDFVMCGVPASIIAAIITILLGYGIISGVVSD